MFLNLRRADYAYIKGVGLLISQWLPCPLVPLSPCHLGLLPWMTIQVEAGSVLLALLCWCIRE